MINKTVLLSALLIGTIIGAGVSAQAQQIMPTFNSTPLSQQGWIYESVNNNLLEVNVFTSSNGVLHQDTVTPGEFQPGGGDNLYRMNNVVSSAKHFSITVKATLLQEAFPASSPVRCGFGFGASTGPNGNGEYYFVCLNTANTELASLYGGVAILNPPNATTFDQAKEHIYRLDVWPGMGARLFVDGTLIFQSGVQALSPTDHVPQGTLFFGDLTGGSNAKVDISHFVYSEDACSF